MQKKELVRKLLEAKEKSGKTYDDLAVALGLTNSYVAQLFHAQAQLQPEYKKKLAKVVPGLTQELLGEMCKCPMRSYDPALIQEPNVYRMTEICLHYGESIKAIMNEKFGDGIMSAIDFRLTVDKVKGDKGEDRMVVTMNGKFLAHIVQTKA
jgi:cyanate lyase